MMACEVALLNPAIAQESSPPNFGVQKNNQPDLSDPNFSSPGGVYQVPFNLVLSCNSLGTSVIYTTDGTLPSLKNGTRTEAGKPALLQIGKTTIVRAFTITKEGECSMSLTQTYLFSSEELLPVNWVATRRTPGAALDQSDAA